MRKELFAKFYSYKSFPTTKISSSEYNRKSSFIYLKRLLNVVAAKNDKDIYLVFEFMDTDLHAVIRKGGILQDAHQRYIMAQAG